MLTKIIFPTRAIPTYGTVNKLYSAIDNNISVYIPTINTQKLKVSSYGKFHDFR